MLCEYTHSEYLSILGSLEPETPRRSAAARTESLRPYTPFFPTRIQYVRAAATRQFRLAHHKQKGKKTELEHRIVLHSKKIQIVLSCYPRIHCAGLRFNVIK